MEQMINYTQWNEEKIKELLAVLQANENIKITVLVENEEKQVANEREKIIGQYLHRLGIPSHLRGYGYIKYGIIRCIKYPEELECVTKILYPNIAKKYCTTSGKVEHGIRHAIARAWENKMEEEWKDIFGSGFEYSTGKPSNSRFLATVTDYIMINNKIL